MQRIKILDSMRGLAALVVFFHHVYTRFTYLYAGIEPAFLHRILSFISDLNVEAVIVFFILSGFSIRLSLQKGLPVTKPLFNEYVYRRLKRILPLYYIAILITIIAGFIIHSIGNDADFNIKNLIGNILFLQCSKSYKGDWFAPYGENGPLWSLSFEMFYYFFFPVFMLFIFRWLKINTLTEKINRYALCCAFLISLACIFINTQFFFPYIAFAALFYIWYAGFFLAHLYLLKQVRRDNNFVLMVSLMILTGLMLYAKSSAEIYKLFFSSCIVVLFFVFYMLRKKYYFIFSNYVDGVLNFLFYKIGKGSYALYLLHYPLLMVLMYYRANVFVLLASIIVLVPLCIWLEKYFVKKKWLFLRINYIR